MQTTAIGTVANSLPENEVILLTLLILDGYILFAELRKFLKKHSAGVMKLSFSRGLAFIFFLTLAIFPSVTVLMSAPWVYIYCLTSLFPFSMAPFSMRSMSRRRTPGHEAFRLSTHARRIRCRCPW